MAGVARADVAAAAVTVLADPASHRGATYHLTGPEPLTIAEAADVLAEVTGRPVSFHAETVEEAYASRRSRWPAPQWQYDAWVSTYLAIARGELAGVTQDVAQLTGRSPQGMREVLESVA